MATAKDAVVASGQLVPFPQLRDSHYVATTFSYASQDSKSPVNLGEWIEVYRKSVPTYKKHAAQDSSVAEGVRQEKVEQFATEFNRILDTLKNDPSAEIPGYNAQPVSVVSLCAIREQCLRNAGFGDIFKTVKDKENDEALRLLPGVLRDLDDIKEAGARLESALRGVFAGNIFDLGAAASADRYASGDMSFEDTKAKLVDRPWVIDDLNRLLRELQRQPYRKAVMFVDNAGSDVVLGMLPFARELLKTGTEVILAANEQPTINDITAAELRPLVAAAAKLDDVIAEATSSGRLRVASSGNDVAVLDLKRVDAQLARDCENVDLVILEGMGRSIETNLYAEFKVDSACLGMIKHAEVAACLGGRLYDCVCKFATTRQEDNPN